MGEISATPIRRRVLFHGRVQGVGFRPFIYRLAVACQLTGRVGNVSAGVRIEIEGCDDDLLRFREEVLHHLPPGARIDAISWESIAPSSSTAFVIEQSDETGPLLARVEIPVGRRARARDQ